jgi:hypothetical protein
MQLSIDFWQFLALEVSLLGGVGGLMLKVGHGLLKAFMQQFEARLAERFSAAERARDTSAAHWEARFAAVERGVREIERGQAAIQEEMLRDYVRREDSVRDQTVTQARLDALAGKLDLLTHIKSKGQP